MNEAERFLADKLKRTEAPAQGAKPEKMAARDAQTVDTAVPKMDKPSMPERKADSGGKAWSVGMAIFAVLMTVFWMAMFKGGCR